MFTAIITKFHSKYGLLAQAVFQKVLPRGIGDKKAVFQKVLPRVIGDTSDFGKRFANQNRSFYKYSYKKVAPGTRGAH